MEKQKLIYEEKALVTLQKATQEKTEALSKAEMLQVKHLNPATFIYLIKEKDTTSLSSTYLGFLMFC